MEVADDIITTASDEHDVVLAVVVEEGDTGTLAKRAQDQRLLHVTQVPNTELALGSAIESRCDKSLVVDPFQALLAGALMKISTDSLLLRARVHNDDALVLADARQCLAIGVPSEGSRHVRKIHVGENGLVSTVLVDIPDFNSLVDRASCHNIFNGGVPPDLESLSGVSIEGHVSIGGRLSATLVVIEDPAVNFTVIGASREESVLEGRPLQIVNLTCVALKEGDGSIELLGLVSVENGDRGGLFPLSCDHFTIESDTVILV
jgi:hypothetical protein|mmetsp:Transcript_21649/g.29001  ORF Transcript_21649/g.29001 Transcript_21649/m.29001 type:complete len:262 (-) Transcript_21649:89-874(-)